MLKKICGALLIVSSLASTSANASGALPMQKSEPACFPWYVLLGTGYAWSEKVGTSNPDPHIWDFANEGYDARIGNEAFYTLGIGREIGDYLNTDLSYTSFSQFHYQKNQTGSSTSNPGFTGNSRTRFYDLDNKNVLINLMLHPAYSSRFILQVGEMNIIPFIGAGAGIGINRVGNFHTVTQEGATTSISKPETTTAFAWQGSAGLSLHPEKSHFFFDLGYRYYDGGKYETSDEALVNVGGANGTLLTNLPRWKGRLTTNQIFANVRLAF